MAIEFRNITKHYGSVTALRNVSLDIDEGEFVTLLGPSGCGKTTLLSIAAGLIEPDEGEVLIGGRPMTGVAANRRPTGMVFQNYALFPHMTVDKNISFGLRMRRASKADTERKVREVAGLVGIGHLLDRYPSQLSGGQQQRVALARTLAVEPYVLLLDEPLAALDRKLRIEMRTEIRRLLDKIGITSIFVTHDQEEALTMSDKIAVMDDGVVAQYATPLEIYDRPATSFVASFVGNSNLLAGTVQLAEAGNPVLHSDGVTVPLPRSFADRVGHQIRLLLRPEHLEVATRTEGKAPSLLSIPGRIAFATHLGVSVEYEVELEGGGQLRIGMPRSRGQRPIAEGAEVWVTPTDDVSFLTVDDQLEEGSGDA